MVSIKPQEPGGSAQMKEKDFQRKVIQMIKKEFPEMWFYKASDRFITGIPDLVGCYKGRMWAIELKVKNNKPTELQSYTMQQMRNAGAMVIWANNLIVIRSFLQMVSENPTYGLDT